MIDYNGSLGTCQPPIDRVLSRLQGVHRAGKGWIALCPAHDDRKPSLSVSEGPDGQALLYCHAGCRRESIVRALGLEMRDLFPPKPERKPKPERTSERKVVAVYPYVDESGKLLFEVVRYEPKTFAQRRPDGQGGYIYNINDVRRVLYRLPDVLRSVQSGETVFIVEGEKDADALGGLGLVATTNPHGAGKWRDDYSETLKGAHVVILPDKDDAGRKHAEHVARSLWGKASSIKIVELPGDGIKDVSDWLKSGGTKEQLQELVAQAQEWQPQAAPAAPVAEISLNEEFTDRNNALILAEQLRGTALWVPAWGWLLWTGARWERDPDGSRVLALARELLPRHYLERALQAADYKERERLCEHAKRAHKRHNISNALELAKGDLRAEPKEFDQNPWLLNCSNGVLDLRTGELHPHSPELRLTKLCPVEYNPNAQAPTWERFLREIFLDDDELIRYVQRACGYSISGDVREDKMFICWGTGANGKSTFLQTLRRVLGDYAGAIAPAAIVHKGGKDSHPTAVADLYGLRFAIAVETEEDQRLAEAQVKALTGRDSIKARFMHRDYFEFEPRAKIWLATNHKPLIRDTSPAIWRRIALIPFRAFFPPERQDKTLSDRLWQERAGILAWLVQGSLAWQQQGLGECDVVAEATESYKSEMDALQDWLSERCVPDAKAVTIFKELYDDYVSWCEQTDQEPLGKRAFGNRLTEKGFDAVKATGGTRARRGLQLRPPSGSSSGASGSSGSTSDILPKKSLYMGKISKPEPTEPLKPLDEPLDDEDCPF